MRRMTLSLLLMSGMIAPTVSSDGKRGLNFDEYTSYRLMKQYRRFNDIIEQVQKDKMPLPSYLIIHRNAILTTDEKNELEQWCTAMRDSMKATFPIDSLERRPRK